MIFLIVIFSLSFLGLAVMFALKIYENNSGQKTFLSGLSKHDEYVDVKLNEIKGRVVKTGDDVLHLATTKLPAHAIHTAMQTKDILKEKYEKILPDIRGSRILKKGGKISEYLKKITDHKEQNGKGRIEDN